VTNRPMSRFNPRLVEQNAAMANVPLIGRQPQAPPVLDQIGGLCRVVFHGPNYADEGVRIRKIIEERGIPGTVEEAYTLELVDALAGFQGQVRAITATLDERKAAEAKAADEAKFGEASKPFEP
jgi:hypothetical protein